MIDRPDIPSLSAKLISAADNVVELQDGALSQSHTRFQTCADLYEYWQHLRGDRQMPVRSEFDPRDIQSSIAGTFVVEKVAPRVARIRVSGSVLNDTLGMDVRGMPITALFDPIARDTVSEAINDLFVAPSMVVLDLTARHGFPRKSIHARMVLLPLSDAAGNITRAVGCLDIKGEISKTPLRFKVSSVRHTELTGDAPLAHPVETATFSQALADRQSEPSFAFAEGVTEFRPKRHDDAVDSVKTSAGPSKLRLIVDNDV